MYARIKMELNLITKCLYCEGDLLVIGPDDIIHRSVKCTKCGYFNNILKETKKPEIIIVKHKERE